MVDGVALLMAPFFPGVRSGGWSLERGTNIVDSGAPFYDCYLCADGRYVAVGAIEPQFYAALLAGLGLDPAELPDQHDESSWPETKTRFAAVFATRPRDEWVAHFAGHDACVAPVLTTDETFGDAHMTGRGTVVEVAGVPQAAPAPRFSATPATLDRPPPAAGDHTDEILAELGYPAGEVEALRSAGAVA
jgi:alpha-methylacyl-CoA racemase